MKKRTIFIWLVVVLCAGLLMVACDRDGTEEPPEDEEVVEEETPVEEEPEVEGVVVQGPIRPDIVLDPALYDDDYSAVVDSYIYEGLVYLNENGDIIPALAMDLLVSEDELDYIFYLRPEVVFHDGSELDADAVVANFNRWFDPEDPLHGEGAYEAWETIFLGFRGECDDGSGGVCTGGECLEDCNPRSSFDGAEKVDDLTVLIHLNRQDPEFLENLALPYFSIASIEALEAAGEDYGTMEGGAIGTGAFTIATWTSEHIILLSNPTYWGEQPGIAGLEFPFE